MKCTVEGRLPICLRLLFTLAEAKPDAVFTTHVPSVYVFMLGGKPEAGFTPLVAS